MVKKKDFIAKISINICLGLLEVLPEEDTLEDMYYKFKQYLKEKYFLEKF